MGLLDVNVLVALAWDSHVHHVAARAWFRTARDGGWATCPVTESGFVRVSSNPKVLPSPVSVSEAVRVLAALRAVTGHRFVADDVSLTDPDVQPPSHSRHVTDMHLLALAGRHGLPLVTFDSGVSRVAPPGSVTLLRA